MGVKFCSPRRFLLHATTPTQHTQKYSPGTATPDHLITTASKTKIATKKVHKKKKLVVDSRTDTPLKMTEAKRKAHVWAVFFHTLETIDVITVSATLACAGATALRAQEREQCRVLDVYLTHFSPLLFHASRY